MDRDPGGFVPFTNSRVMPDGTLRPYDPAIDTPGIRRASDYPLAHWQIVFGKLTKVFPFAIVTYCVQQTDVVPNGGEILAAA